MLTAVSRSVVFAVFVALIGDPAGAGQDFDQNSSHQSQNSSQQREALIGGGEDIHGYSRGSPGWTSSSSTTGVSRLRATPSAA